MARITVQDCLEQVDNRFELVLSAAQRARQVSLGAEPRLPRENDKPTVIALREIAAALVGREVLDEPESDTPAEAIESEAPATESAGLLEAADATAGPGAASEAEAEAEAGPEDAADDEQAGAASAAGEDADPGSGSAEDT